MEEKESKSKFSITVNTGDESRTTGSFIAILPGNDTSSLIVNDVSNADLLNAAMQLNKIAREKAIEIIRNCGLPQSMLDRLFNMQ